MSWYELKIEMKKFRNDYCLRPYDLGNVPRRNRIFHQRRLIEKYYHVRLF
jgi:hypothetical protein